MDIGHSFRHWTLGISSQEFLFYKEFLCMCGYFATVYNIIVYSGPSSLFYAQNCYQRHETLDWGIKLRENSWILIYLSWFEGKQKNWIKRM